MSNNAIFEQNLRFFVMDARYSWTPRMATSYILYNILKWNEENGTYTLHPSSLSHKLTSSWFSSLDDRSSTHLRNMYIYHNCSHSPFLWWKSLMLAFYHKLITTVITFRIVDSFITSTFQLTLTPFPAGVKSYYKKGPVA